MNEMTCERRNVKGVTHGDKTERIISAVPLSSTDHFSIFQLFVLIILPANKVLINLQPQALINPLYLPQHQTGDRLS